MCRKFLDVHMQQEIFQGEEGHHVIERANLLIGKIHNPIICLDAMEEGKRLCR